MEKELMNAFPFLKDAKKLSSALKESHKKFTIDQKTFNLLLFWALKCYFKAKNLSESLDLRKIIEFVASEYEYSEEIIQKEFSDFICTDQNLTVLSDAIFWDFAIIQVCISINFQFIWKTAVLELKREIPVKGLNCDSKNLLLIQKIIHALISKHYKIINSRDLQELKDEILKILRVKAILKENQKFAGILLCHSESLDLLDILKEISKEPIQNYYSVLSLWRGLLLLEQRKTFLDQDNLWKYSYNLILNIYNSSDGLIRSLAVQTLSDWFLAADGMSLEDEINQIILFIIHQLQLPFDKIKEKVIVRN